MEELSQLSKGLVIREAFASQNRPCLVRSRMLHYSLAGFFKNDLDQWSFWSSVNYTHTSDAVKDLASDVLSDAHPLWLLS